MENAKTLKDVPVGKTVRVVKVNGEGAIRRRIMDMGITKGVEIYVRKVARVRIPRECDLHCLFSPLFLSKKSFRSLFSLRSQIINYQLSIINCGEARNASVAYIIIIICRKSRDRRLAGRK